jgi:hypothetical protein
VVKQNPPRLPFSWGFIGGIIIIVVMREIGLALGCDWLIYLGAIVGLAVSGRDVFRALKNMK